MSKIFQCRGNISLKAYLCSFRQKLLENSLRARATQRRSGVRTYLDERTPNVFSYRAVALTTQRVTAVPVAGPPKFSAQTSPSASRRTRKRVNIEVLCKRIHPNRTRLPDNCTATCTGRCTSNGRKLLSQQVLSGTHREKFVAKLRWKIGISPKYSHRCVSLRVSTGAPLDACTVMVSALQLLCDDINMCKHRHSPESWWSCML